MLNQALCLAPERNIPRSPLLMVPPKSCISEVRVMAHVILLGDSVFDNLRYVQPEPDVMAQLRETLPAGWKASLRAVDGAVTNDVAGQLANLPADVTHLVLSVGGNDLLACAGELLRTPVTVSSDVFLLLARVTGVFESMYRRVVERCLRTGLPLVVCTIY